MGFASAKIDDIANYIPARLGVILLSLPITSTIANLAKDNHIIYAFLWLILLLFVWAIGVFMFIIGLLVHKLNDDDIYGDK